MEYEQKVRKKVWEIFGNSKKSLPLALANRERNHRCQGWPLRLSVRTQDFHS